MDLFSLLQIYFAASWRAVTSKQVADNMKHTKYLKRRRAEGCLRIRAGKRSVLLTEVSHHFKQRLVFGPCSDSSIPLYMCVHNAFSSVFVSVWQRRLPARSHNQSRSAASFTSSPVLSFLWSVTRCHSNTTKLNFNVFLLPNPAAASGSAPRSHCGRETQPGGSWCDWPI